LSVSFIVLWFIVGFVDAIAIALLGVLLWKAHGFFVSSRWWNSQSKFERQMADFVHRSISDGGRSSNTWLQMLAEPKLDSVRSDYELKLFMRRGMISAEQREPAQGWTDWGATRVDENVTNQTQQFLLTDVGSEGQPLLGWSLMIQKCAFEVLVAEHALGLLGVANPREAIQKRTAELDAQSKDPKKPVPPEQGPI